MMYGLSDRDIQTLFEILVKYPEVEEVHVFGSRAKGNFHKGSDIDLVIMNKDVSAKLIQRLLSDFKESTLPYFVDVINYQTTKHSQLKEHIDKVGRLLYRKENVSVAHEPRSVYPEKDKQNRDK